MLHFLPSTYTHPPYCCVIFFNSYHSELPSLAISTNMSLGNYFIVLQFAIMFPLVNLQTSPNDSVTATVHLVIDHTPPRLIMIFNVKVNGSTKVHTRACSTLSVSCTAPSFCLAFCSGKTHPIRHQLQLTRKN